MATYEQHRALHEALEAVLAELREIGWPLPRKKNRVRGYSRGHGIRVVGPSFERLARNLKERT